MDDPIDAWADPDGLADQQERVGRLQPEPWEPRGVMHVAGCFVAFARGEQGPGRAGDRAWVGAAMVRVEPGGTDCDLREVARSVVEGHAGGRYVPGLLAMREGAMLVAGLRALFEVSPAPDVVMVDATGRDHPRRCGMAVHIGWLLDLPTVGVTHRRLTGRSDEQPQLLHRGEAAPIGEVARWVCTRDGVRPLVTHGAWRTAAEVAAELVVRTATAARTPEPLRLAREAARAARAEHDPA